MPDPLLSSACRPPGSPLTPDRAHHALRWILPVLAIALTAPSIGGGLIADDYYHRFRMVSQSELRDMLGPRWDLFAFFDGDAERTRTMMEMGGVPWWTHPEIRAAFFRPLTVVTHWLDYTLWPDSAAMMHVQSVLWFGALALVVANCYRRMMGVTWAAALAALIYVIDDARGMPVGFIANRNALLATVFGVLSITAHDRWRRGDWRIGAIAAPFCFLLALLSAEAGTGAAAYLFAHVLFLEPRRGWKRWLALAPHAAVGLGWAATWRGLGYGVANMGLYTDPLREPLAFLAGGVVRAPTLLLGQWALPPSDIALMLSPDDALAVALVGVMTLVALAVVIGRRVDWNRANGFWMLGMLLALAPCCATFPSDRMLFFIGLGAFAILAQFLVGLFGGGPSVPASRTTRWVGCGLIAIHIAFAPILQSVRAAFPAGPSDVSERLTVRAPLDAGIAEQTLVIVTAPSVLHAAYLPMQRDFDGLPFPERIRVLAPALPAATITRVDERTLVIRPERGYIRFFFDRLFRSERFPMRVGDQVHLSDITVEVSTLTPDGRPDEVAFRFAVPLEDKSLRWLAWVDGDFVPFNPPPAGESIELRPHAPGLELIAR